MVVYIVVYHNKKIAKNISNFFFLYRSKASGFSQPRECDSNDGRGGGRASGRDTGFGILP